MNWARTMVVGCLLLAAPRAGLALGQVSGPVQIGPSSGSGDEQNHRATLSTTITNQGALPDRLVNVACPGSGDVGLPGGAIDLPPSTDGRATPIQAQLDLSNAAVPMTDGALLPCLLYFLHAGQRIVVFSLGSNAATADEP